MDCQCACLCYLSLRRWRGVMEEVDKGCSEFCVTVSSVTRTASILIHSWLKALAVNRSQPSSRLWLCAVLIGLTALAGSKHRKGDEFPCSGLCCLCESFFFFLMGVWVVLLVPAHPGSHWQRAVKTVNVLCVIVKRLQAHHQLAIGHWSSVGHGRIARTEVAFNQGSGQLVICILLQFTTLLEQIGGCFWDRGVYVKATEAETEHLSEPSGVNCGCR